MKNNIILNIFLVLQCAILVKTSHFRVRMEGNRIMVYSKLFCGTKEINPRGEFRFQIQFKGVLSKEVMFDSTKDEKILDIEFPNTDPKVYSNFSLKIYKDTDHEYDVVLLQDGGDEDSYIGCDSENIKRNIGVSIASAPEKKSII